MFHANGDFDLFLVKFVILMIYFWQEMKINPIDRHHKQEYLFIAS
jgi:hypothetical protein